MIQELCRLAQVQRHAPGAGMFYVGMFTAREAAAIAWSAFLCVSASFLRSADVRPAPPPGCRTAHNRVGIV